MVVILYVIRSDSREPVLVSFFLSLLHLEPVAAQLFASMQNLSESRNGIGRFVFLMPYAAPVYPRRRRAHRLAAQRPGAQLPAECLRLSLF